MLLAAGLYFVFAVAAAAWAGQWLARKRLSRFSTGRTGADWVVLLSERAGLRLGPPGAAAKTAYLPLERRVVLLPDAWEGRDVWAAAAAAHEVGHAVEHARGGLAGFLLAAADMGPRLLVPAMAGLVAAALAGASPFVFLAVAAALAAGVLGSGLWAFSLAAGIRDFVFALGRAWVGAAGFLCSALAGHLPGVASAVFAFALFGGLPLACLELAGEWRASRWAGSSLLGDVPPESGAAVWAVLGAALGSHTAPGLLWALVAAGMAEAAAGALWSPGLLPGLFGAAGLWLVLLWRHRRLCRQRSACRAGGPVVKWG